MRPGAEKLAAPLFGQRARRGTGSSGTIGGAGHRLSMSSR
ncbi:hypothetical protein RGAI101_3281 [Roseobacter sp. GAI101]|nr:hypothetical protein RGAI101_3281 [Roseobacter sp. GAI101]